MDLNKFITDWLNGWFINNSSSKSSKPKRKYTKRTYSEKDCDVWYDPTWLYKMNLPYAEYVDFIEIH